MFLPEADDILHTLWSVTPPQVIAELVPQPLVIFRFAPYEAVFLEEVLTV